MLFISDLGWCGDGEGERGEFGKEEFIFISYFLK